MKIFNTLMPGTVALSPQSDCGKPSVSGFNFMKEIKLGSKKYPGKVALVDDEDYEILSKYNWFVSKRRNVFYATKRTGNTHTFMHRFLLSVSDKFIEVDHVDHNGLNNQRNNIRATTRSQNASNMSSHNDSTSKYVGVSWDRNRRKWQAQIRSGQVSKHLGRFNNEVEAATAYNKEAVKIHGEFANLNKI